LWDLAAGKTMATLTHHKKSVRALTIHPTEYSFASGSAGGNNIKKWKCPEGAFVHNFAGHNAIINTLSVNADGVMFSGGEKTLFLGTLLIPVQLIMEHCPSGIMLRVCRSSISMTFHNPVLSMLKQECSAPHLT
jgi:WD40 repeat protein